MIKAYSVENVDSFRYLGVHLDSKLNWSVHIDSIVKNLNTRLYCIRKLTAFNVDKQIAAIFYNFVLGGV
ncbi:hypothetical protein HOLleu_22089 [Holothuria leucospilota]|uniref:Uncharacterized protein n=1 Tax=Holothuria leucospilota TaxID=206669 RepID=A0A9Q1BYN5_HOLLE|nr:hypothetical protein HOLleu_22089 [Holothuria leucospilota]